MRTWLCLLLVAGAVGTKHYDAVVIGGGGGGANFAVSARDAGYHVAVLEKKRHLGGHCDTALLEPPVDGQSTIELGVTYVHNTSRSNEEGFYNADPWQVDLAAYFARFGNVVHAGPLGFKNGTQYAGDTEHGEGAFAQPAADPAQVTAFIKFVAQYLKMTYPELEQGYNPDLIRPILRLSIKDFFANEPVLGQFPGLFTPSAMSVVEVGWMWTWGEAGCRQAYDNITNYIGADADSDVFVNASVFKVTRPNGHGHGKVTVHFQVNDGTPQVVTGDWLVVAIPPTLENLAAIGLTLRAEEYALMQHFEVSPGYWGIKFSLGENVAGFSNANSRDPLGELNLTAAPLVNFYCEFNNESSCSGNAVAANAAQDVLAGVDGQCVAMTEMSPLPLHVTVTEARLHDGYYPHVQSSVLQANPSFFGQLNALQKTAQTVWIGAGPSTAAHTNVIEHGHRVRKTILPDRATRRDFAENGLCDVSLARKPDWRAFEVPSLWR